MFFKEFLDFDGFQRILRISWIFPGFFHEVYGIFGVKCPSVKWAASANFRDVIVVFFIGQL